MIPAWICATCGVQQAPADAPPAACPICDDDRQYVGHGGQRWTTLAELARQGHRSVLREQEPGLVGLGVEPAFAIGQRALLVRTDAGNLLWDPPGFVDDAAVAAVRELGGLAGVASSHPHFHGVQVEWSAAFGGVPVWVCADDLQWVQRPSPAITPWRGAAEVLPGVTLVQCGGHFAGSAVVHWAAGAGGRGALLVGDTITVVMDRRFVSFMRSYPNHLPLPAAAVRQVAGAVASYRFDRVYGGWWSRVIDSGGQEALRRSAQRYVSWISGEAWRERP